MGAPTSSIFSEMFIQFTEHTEIIDILTRNQILGYFRYVDDVLLVYDTTLTDIHTVLDSFNKATAPLQFTIEEESQKRINYLDITIYRDVHQSSTNSHTEFTEKQQPQITSYLQPLATHRNTNTVQLDSYKTACKHIPLANSPENKRNRQSHTFYTTTVTQ
jgi:hypothetical protein